LLLGNIEVITHFLNLKTTEETFIYQIQSRSMNRSGGHTLGSNLVLASVLAILSYVPFEFVAKVTLLLSAFLFIVDPFPPLSRIIALISLFIVSILSRFYNNHVHDAAAVADAIVVVDDNSTVAPKERHDTAEADYHKTERNHKEKNT
jgi:hypothetical protein